MRLVRRPRREAEHEACDTGRCEQAYSKGLHSGKHHQTRTGGQQQHDDQADAPQDIDLGMHAPRREVVLHVETVAPLDAPGRGVDGDDGAPAEQDHHADLHQATHGVAKFGVELGRGQHDDQREQDRGEPPRPGNMLQDRAGHAFAGEEPPH